MISDGVSVGTANIFANPSMENLDSQPTNMPELKAGGGGETNHAHVLSFSEDNTPH
jgi:hypothetical protein